MFLCYLSLWWNWKKISFILFCPFLLDSQKLWLLKFEENGDLKEVKMSINDVKIFEDQIVFCTIHEINSNQQSIENQLREVKHVWGLRINEIIDELLLRVCGNIYLGKLNELFFSHLRVRRVYSHTIEQELYA